MAYSKQTFTTGQVLTAAQQNQLESNVADHVHGRDAVAFTGVSWPRSAKSSNFTVSDTDAGELFECTGTFTVNFDAAADLGSGHAVTIFNAGTGTLTLDPDSGAGETINGLANFVLAQKAAAFVYSDGTNLFVIVLSGGSFTKIGATQTAAADATITFTGLDVPGVGLYRISFAGVYSSAGSMLIRAGDGGGIVSSANYRWGRRGTTSTPADLDAADNAATSFTVGGSLGDTIAETSHGTIWLSGFGNASMRANATWHIGGSSENVGYGVSGGGHISIDPASGTFDQIQFLLTSGTYTAGSFTLEQFNK